MADELDSLLRLRAALERPPRIRDDGEHGRAAVAVVLRPSSEGGKELQVLFIKRALHPEDPWSGDIAFPGGRLDPCDAGPQHAAERETREEIGLDLAPGQLLGRLDDLSANILPMTVSAFVYLHLSDAELVCSPEVERPLWASLSRLVDPDMRTWHCLERRGELQRFPAVDLLGPGHPPLWGVTYRFVLDLLQLLGRELSVKIDGNGPGPG
ncbi:MAG: CoA pyrophosphatase [Candidatus Latescibacterota bacterium]|nr:CoA pyrophosphatase [Candidatus Latescibacterota bacterium]